MEEINGYILLEEFKTENAGQSRWSCCQKSGRKFFIKEFCSPVYPEDTVELSPRTIERKRKSCESFYNARSSFYELLRRSRTGNNVLIQDFFLAGSHFYITTDFINSIGTDPHIIADLGEEQKLTFLQALSYSIAALHREHIIHADLKPDNILIKRTTDGFVTGKIVDFDSSFCEGHEPKEVQGDFRYFAPETFLQLEGKKTNTLSCKADIFALGILFHEYWTGSRPQFSDDYSYAYEAVLDRAGLRIEPSIPVWLSKEIGLMLSLNPERRPNADDVLYCLKNRGANSGRRNGEVRTDGFRVLDDSRLQ